MDTLAENLQVVQKTSDAGELKAALNKMRTAAVDAQKVFCQSVHVFAQVGEGRR
jgi:soluble cytochrome b562